MKSWRQNITTSRFLCTGSSKSVIWSLYICNYNQLTIYLILVKGKKSIEWWKVLGTCKPLRKNIYTDNSFASLQSFLAPALERGILRIHRQEPRIIITSGLRNNLLFESLRITIRRCGEQFPVDYLVKGPWPWHLVDPMSCMFFHFQSSESSKYTSV